MRRSTVPILLVLFTGMGAAAGPAFLDVGPGMVQPNSPFYGIEVALDRIAMGLGMADPDRLVQERAAEALEMARRNNTRGVARAAEQIRQIAPQAARNDSRGLALATLILRGIKDNTVNEGRQNVVRALDRIREVQSPGVADRMAQQIAPPQK